MTWHFPVRISQPAKLAIVAWLLLVPTGDTVAQSEERSQGQLLGYIIAVVNDRVISWSDLTARLGLVILTANFPDSEEIRQRLLPRILRGLIDESLRWQAALQASVEVSESEVAQALADLAQRNGLHPDQLRELLRQRGIPFWTLREQIVVDLAWRKLVLQRFRPLVRVRAEEIDDVLGQIRSSIGATEHRVREIFLPVAQPQEEQTVLAAAQELAQQLRTGARFAEVARQFSQSASAARGGDLGWVRRGQLAAPLDQSLPLLLPGQISEPIRTRGGYYLLLLAERDVITTGGEVGLTVQRVGLPSLAGQTRFTEAERVAHARQLRQQVTSCTQLAEQLEQIGMPEPTDMGVITDLSTLPTAAADLIADLPVGRLSPPLLDGDEVVVWIVCERTISSPNIPSREAVAEGLAEQKIARLQQRYLQQLRRSAFVDIRL